MQLRGVRPFFSNKFDIEKYLKRRPAAIKPEEPFDLYEIDGDDLQEETDHEQT